MRSSGPARSFALAGLSALALVCAWASSANAETLSSALAKAYHGNPQLNAQRAALRAADENVPQALSGYRPRISATADLGGQYIDAQSNVGGVSQGQSGLTAPRGVGITASQTLFNGLQTANRTRQAETQVSSTREALRMMEQQILLDAVTAYMNVLRDNAILETQRKNVEVLQEQLRQTRDRFNVGEVTRTDVAQSESRLAASQSAFLNAQANATTSRAFYRRVIGSDPVALQPGTPVDRFTPNRLDAAIARGRAEHPQVTAAMFGIDVAMLQVKINEGALYPVLTLDSNVSQRYDTSPSSVQTFTGSVVGRLTIPIYQGGAEYANIRQSKEIAGQRRIELENVRDLVRATVVQSWGQLEAAKAQVAAAEAQVEAAEIALNGVQEEARVGQRTTLDVLNAQQELVNARVNRVTAQRDRVVASYALLAATGRLNVRVLGVAKPYEPMTHYQQVRDSWIGVRTPDGR